jgi:hypothetical protein
MDGIIESVSASKNSPGVALAPLTPRGVAAYAYASNGRLWLVQIVVSLIAAATVVWFLKTNWFPVVRDMFRQLPVGGEVRNQQLQWRGRSPLQLAESSFLALAVNLEDRVAVGGVADVQIEFRRTQLQCCSLLGCFPINYPKDWIIAVDRSNLEPWWGAWEVPILAGVLIATVLALLLNWTVLTALYFPVIYFVGYLRDRELTWGGSWRMAGAGLMPGALFFTLGILLYGLEGLNLIHLGIIFLLHLVIGWVYLVLSPLFLRRWQALPSLPRNPFAPTPEPAADPKLNPPGN